MKISNEEHEKIITTAYGFLKKSDFNVDEAMKKMVEFLKEEAPIGSYAYYRLLVAYSTAIKHIVQDRDKGFF